MENVFIDKEAVLTLKKTNNLIEELLETIDILADKDALKALKESLEDKKTGRVRPLEKFLHDARL